jgi:hypothetical protein
VRRIAPGAITRADHGGMFLLVPQVKLRKRLDVGLLACHGQLRLAPSGHVTGIDMDVALSLASARDYDLVVLSGTAGCRGGSGRGAV